MEPPDDPAGAEIRVPVPPDPVEDGDERRAPDVPVLDGAGAEPIFAPVVPPVEAAGDPLLADL